MAIDGGLRQLFRAHLPAWHWVSIETGSTGRGIPDLEYCFQGQTGWIECKATSAWAVALAPEQIAWLSRRARAGGRAFIAVRRKCSAGPKRGPACDELYLIPGARAAELKASGLCPLGLGSSPAQQWWSGGPARWGWAEIARLLTA